jgi:hypothetical protein
VSYETARSRALKFLVSIVRPFRVPLRGCGGPAPIWITVWLVIFVVSVVAVVKMTAAGLDPMTAVTVIGACSTVAIVALARLFAVIGRTA